MYICVYMSWFIRTWYSISLYHIIVFFIKQICTSLWARLFYIEAKWPEALSWPCAKRTTGKLRQDAAQWSSAVTAWRWSPQKRPNCLGTRAFNWCVCGTSAQATIALFGKDQMHWSGICRPCPQWFVSQANTWNFLLVKVEKNWKTEKINFAQLQ